MTTIGGSPLFVHQGSLFWGCEHAGEFLSLLPDDVSGARSHSFLFGICINIYIYIYIYTHIYIYTVYIYIYIMYRTIIHTLHTLHKYMIILDVIRYQPAVDPMDIWRPPLWGPASPPRGPGRCSSAAKCALFCRTFPGRDDIICPEEW